MLKLILNGLSTNLLFFASVFVVEAAFFFIPAEKLLKAVFEPMLDKKNKSTEK